MAWIIVLIIIVVIALYIAVAYNNFISLKQRVQNAWSQIDVQLQRRFDLIPNLVEAVKGYMNHESGTLEKVTALRTSWANAQTPDEKVKLDNELSQTLKTILAVSESYPDLKANQNFLSLQADLKDTESKVSFSRQFYNDTVAMYNTAIQSFPSNIIAGIFHFEPSTLFTVDNSEARNAVKVDFSK